MRPNYIGMLWTRDNPKACQVQNRAGSKNVGIQGERINGSRDAYSHVSS